MSRGLEFKSHPPHCPVQPWPSQLQLLLTGFTLPMSIMSGRDAFSSSAENVESQKSAGTKRRKRQVFGLLQKTGTMPVVRSRRWQRQLGKLGRRHSTTVYCTTDDQWWWRQKYWQRTVSRATKKSMKRWCLTLRWHYSGYTHTRLTIAYKVSVHTPSIATPNRSSAQVRPT